MQSIHHENGEATFVHNFRYGIEKHREYGLDRAKKDTSSHTGYLATFVGELSKHWQTLRMIDTAFNAAYRYLEYLDYDIDEIDPDTYRSYVEYQLAIIKIAQREKHNQETILKRIAEEEEAQRLMLLQTGAIAMRYLPSLQGVSRIPYTPTPLLPMRATSIVEEETTLSEVDHERLRAQAALYRAMDTERANW